MRFVTGLIVAAGLFAQGWAADCPGYHVVAAEDNGNTLTAQLRLSGKNCDVYGEDLPKLKLQVEYQTKSRLHVKVYDEAEDVFQIPEDLLSAPKADGSANEATSDLKFTYNASPFSFKVTRKSSGEVLFDSTGHSLVFESQYLYLRTALPDDPNIYGLGESADPFRHSTGYSHAIWNSGQPFMPPNTNLYGAYPLYYDHRGSRGTHAVFLRNINAMRINIDKDANGSYLEYNTVGGVFDFYFLAGPSPKDLSLQFADVVGKPALMPYWGFGFHQCKYGYKSIDETAEVVANYSKANIPLETMWNDIDYMDGRAIFSLDPVNYPLDKVRALVDKLHANNQHYMMMVDPAVARRDYKPYNDGVKMDTLMKESNGSVWTGVVWAGPSGFPDWFAPNVQDFWNAQFESFFNKDTGVDIDGLWIDMNEPANFCDIPCNPQAAAARGVSESTPSPELIRRKEAKGKHMGLPGRDLLTPKYDIKPFFNGLSGQSMPTYLQHANGLVEYDVHNLFGSMMGRVSRQTLLQRRPGRRPLIITRSSLIGDGSRTGHWFGDNRSNDDDYRLQILQMIQHVAMYQTPMVGSDVCGFNYATNPILCQRWATLGAWNPFYRNHADISAPHQEFYLWPEVAAAARKAIDLRYRLLDYMYTNLHTQHQTGFPMLSPLVWQYPHDPATAAIDLQFFFGEAFMVSPVTTPNDTSVTFYMPDDLFYDFDTGLQVQGGGKQVTRENIAYDEIPVHVRGGSIIPMRVKGAYTTTELRKNGFELLIAPDKDGKASGRLYLDDGDSVAPTVTSAIEFAYENGTLTSSGSFGYSPGVKVQLVTLWDAPMLDCHAYNATSKSLAKAADLSLTETFTFDVTSHCES
ncbi:alpha-glucosidase [Akanthomyces lecanii RCEF 1005]|uniref:alpha-glucosidase n=1 Tax=Akanthomyces lecanii RCEF 1005 TaxID=1081108 RepID=A0A162N3I5_CORDF|nr:alpha-glucosidase [Akanthomyces lecanii RCEF 1005]